jgi:hypothetical protein
LIGANFSAMRRSPVGTIVSCVLAKDPQKMAMESDEV